MAGPKNRRAAIYVRVSLDRSGRSQSPERQEAECRRLAEQKGWEVVEVFGDRNLSAFKRDVRRPGYEALLQAVRSKRVDAVLIYSLSRISRSVRGFSDLLETLQEHGCAIAAVADAIDTSTASGRAMTHITSAFTELEADLTRERVTSAHDRAAELGRMHTGGSRQFGYSRRGEVVPEEAQVVHEVARRLLEGDSLWTVAGDLNARGVRTTMGNRWYAQTVKQMILSPRLAGLRMHHGEALPGDWEPILSPKVRADLLDGLPKRASVRRSVRRHLLTGLVKCGLCGGDLKTMGFRLKNGKPFERYQCVKQPGHDNCGRVAAAKNSLDAFVVNSLFDYMGRASMRSTTEAGVDEGEIEELERAIEADTERLADLAQRYYIEQTIDRPAFEQANRTLRERRTEAEARLTGLRRALDEAAGALRPGSRHDLQAWWDGATVEEQRAALRAALGRVIVHPARTRGGNRFDTSRVELVWRLDFYRLAGEARQAAMTEEEREAARQAYDAERYAELERAWAEEEAERR